jgi:hypothetical protein
VGDAAIAVAVTRLNGERLNPPEVKKMEKEKAEAL